MKISSLNPDAAKEAPAQRYIIKNITRGKIQIAEGQEAHIILARNYIMCYYRINTSSATKSDKTGVVHGGVAVVIREIIQQNTTQIDRRSSRSQRVTIGSKNSKIPIQILCTYAPRSGRAEEGRRHRRGDFKEITNKTCTRHMVIWRADANGQLGRDGEAEEEEGQSATRNHASERIVGPYTRSGNRKGNGKKYNKYARSRN